MKYIVYCTTNLVNKKIYIGVHLCKTNKFYSYLDAQKRQVNQVFKMLSDQEELLRDFNGSQKNLKKQNQWNSKLKVEKQGNMIQKGI